MPKINCIKVGWYDVEAWSRAVSNKIYSSGWRPDSIIAISRGGYVPARMICDKLVVGELVSLQISHWPSAAQMAKEAGVRHPLTCDLTGKKALIVDDISDTGDSIVIAKDHIWTNCKPSELKVATLQWLSSTSKVTPDYYAEEVKGWYWYQYPWTRLEDVIGFVKKIMSENHQKKVWTAGEIADRFPDLLGVTFDKWFYEKAIASLISKCSIRQVKGGYALVEER